MMTAIERIFQFAALPSESPLQIKADSSSTGIILNQSTVSTGVMEFRGVSLKYDPEGANVLQNLSFCTLPAEKIGVVGRTGAGKSSILQVFLQILSSLLNSSIS